MSKKDQKFQEFKDLYSNYCLSQSSDNEEQGASGGVESEIVKPKESDADYLITKSGQRYRRPSTNPPPVPGVSNPPNPLPSSMSRPPTPPLGNTMQSQTPSTTSPTVAPIKVMPSGASVREFTMIDTDYTAHDFIRLCENVMRNSSITSDADKIAFISARVKQGSEASKMMRISALVKPTENNDYATFRKHFLQVFGENASHSLVKGVCLAADRTLEVANSKGLREAQIDAHRNCEDLIKCLKDNNWGTATHISWENASQFLEFFLYMLTTQAKFRRGAQELEFTPGDELLQFVLKLEAKKNATQGNTALIAAATEASHVSSGVASLNLGVTSGTDSAASKRTSVCSFCRKAGHTETRCFERKREVRKSPNTSVASKTYTSHAQSTFKQPSHSQHDSSYRASHSPHDSSYRAPPRSYHNTMRTQSPMRRVMSGGDSYCYLHETNTHSSADCFTLAKIRKDMQVAGCRKTSGMSSGEASRAKKYDPT